MCEFESKLNKQSSEISILMDDLECEKQKRVKLEAYSRRMNLRLLYIPEDIQNIRDHVLNIFNRKSQLVLDSDIDQIHRVGKRKHQSVSPRPVIVRFSSVRIRMAVWEKRRMLNDNPGGNRLTLTEDFPIEWQESRRMMWPIVNKARSMEKPDAGSYKAFLLKDQLMLDNRAYRVETLAELPLSLQLASIYTPMNEDAVSFFTKHSPAPLSNHHRTEFSIDGIKYNCRSVYSLVIWKLLGGLCKQMIQLARKIWENQLRTSTEKCGKNRLNHWLRKA